MKLAKFGKGPEVFASIQGEGRNQGLFSVFVRTSLCNLHCVWCDTDYTWNWIGTRFAHVRDSEPGYSKFDQATPSLRRSRLLPRRSTSNQEGALARHSAE